MSALRDLKVRDDEWSSDSPAVDKLLKRLMRKTKSDSSRKGYLYTLHRFCQANSTTPDEVVTWPREKVESTVQSFTDRHTDSPMVATVNQARLVTFFFVNGFRVGKHSNLELESYSVPARFRRTEEYIPTDEEIRDIATKAGVGLRNRCGILLLYTAGLRNSTMRALRWEDFPDLETCGDKPLYVPIYPEMKRIDPDSCKGRVPYFTFAAPETVEALRNYKRFIEERYGIVPGQVIFMSTDRRKTLDEKRFIPISKTILEGLVKTAAKNVGISKWKQVHPHVFRKAYESRLRNSGLDLKDQEFLMGHILDGSMDCYYDKTKIEDLRAKYNKVVFFPDVSREVRDELEEARKEIANLKHEREREKVQERALIDRLASFEERFSKYEQFTKKFMELNPDELAQLEEKMQEKREENWKKEEREADIEYEKGKAEFKAQIERENKNGFP
ncbi:MAG: tyrosine-type recombinase/integrase [Thaumarchaeota archaeon]|nr:tyrosine-type recombinase/integrase [Nitrososphaerota archaeon]